MNAFVKKLLLSGIKTQRNIQIFPSALAWSKPTIASFLAQNKTIFSPQEKRNFQTCSSSLAWSKPTTPRSFLEHNKKVFPPQEIGEEPRPAFICHQKTNFKYSPEKLWYIASFVRGMTVDEAVKQLSFVHKKGAIFVKEAILEAQELAVKEHNVEFRSNLWIAESFAGKGMCIKGMRRHARRRMGEVRYQYCHYFVRLEEGKPPVDYYKLNPITPEEQLNKWLEQMRKRKITNSY